MQSVRTAGKNDYRFSVSLEEARPYLIERVFERKSRYLASIHFEGELPDKGLAMFGVQAISSDEHEAIEKVLMYFYLRYYSPQRAKKLTVEEEALLKEIRGQQSSPKWLEENE